jgi:hypothetical protein
VESVASMVSTSARVGEIDTAEPTTIGNNSDSRCWQYGPGLTYCDRCEE